MVWFATDVNGRTEISVMVIDDEAPLRLTDGSRPATIAMMVSCAKSDAALILTYGRHGRLLTDSELGAVLGHAGPGGRNVVSRLMAGRGSDDDIERISSLFARCQRT